MSEPDNANKQVMIEDDDISLDSVTTRVELRENGIAACYLTANNEDGKLYLKSLHLNDRVVVKFVAESAPPTAINWGSVTAVFDGKVQELSPSMNTESQVCQVVAFGKGFQLKEMRISKQYGFITPVLSWGFVNHFDETITEWNSTTGYKRGTAPYVYSYSGLGFPLGLAFNYLTHCIYTELSGHIGDQIGAFTLGISPEYDGGALTVGELHIVGGIYDNGSGHATGVTFKAYWTTDTGASPTWYEFSAGNFPTITFLMDSDGANNPVWETYSLIEAHPNENYKPELYESIGPPTGDDVHIHITTELPYWDKNFKIKIELQGVSGTVAGGVSIALVYLKYQFEDLSGKTVRQLLVGEQGTVGIIPNFVDKIFESSTTSGYDVLNTDYVVKDNPATPSLLIPFMKFPYMDALTGLQEIIKYGSALKFLTGGVGYHWKIDINGNLLVAPTTDHNVTGIDGNHTVEDVWTLQPFPTPIKVKQDMLLQEFKATVPLANYVLIAGKYHYPLNDNICRGLNIGYWRYAGGIGLSGSRATVLVNFDETSYSPCLEFQCVYDPIVSVNNIYAYPLPEGCDLTKLMGFNTAPTISFWLKVGGGTSDYELRLYPEDPENLGYPDWKNFYAVTIANDVGPQDTWKYITIAVPNTVYMKEYGNWKVRTDALFGLEVPTIDWFDMPKVKYWSIRYNATSVAGVPYVRMRGFSIDGIVLRAAYDSLSISGPITVNGQLYPNGFGCRMQTIKDSMSSTDTLSPDDDKSPLALEAIYDLQRYRKLRITGEIAVPLDPIWEEGQQVWIQAEDCLPVGASYQEGVGDPTTSTVGTIGSYYINSTNSEVFQCTNIVEEVYTWTDLERPRYNIDKWFRVNKVIHEFSSRAAMTRLDLTDDLYSSLTVDTNDVYTVLMRLNNPDFQSKTMGSLKSNADFDLGLPIISKDYSGYAY